MSSSRACAWAAATALAIGVAASSPAGAHHTFAMFSMGKTVVLNAQVTRLQWANPHASLVVSVPGASGQPAQEWWIEMGSIGRISRGGWRPDTVKPGDRIAVAIHPLKDGSNGGSFVHAILPNGRKIGQTGGDADIPAAGGDEAGLKQADREDAAMAARRRQGL